MSKHLFTVSSYGPTHLGEFVRRTEKFTFYRDNRGFETRCLTGAAEYVVETDDPVAALEAAKSAHQSCRAEIARAERGLFDEIARAERGLFDARERRRNATIKALEEFERVEKLVDGEFANLGEAALTKLIATEGVPAGFVVVSDHTGKVHYVGPLPELPPIDETLSRVVMNVHPETLRAMEKTNG